MNAFAQWQICEACGRWQRADVDSPCSLCRWPRLLPPHAEATNAWLVRVLVDAELRFDGLWQIARLNTSRLGDALDAPAVLGRLAGAALPFLTNAGRGVPELRAWTQFREAAQGVLEAEYNGLLRRCWEGLRPPSSVQLSVAARALLLHPQIEVIPFETPAWLELVPFQRAAEQNGRSLRAGSVSLECGAEALSFDADGDRVHGAMVSPVELVVRSCEVAVEGKLIWTVPTATILPRGERLALPPIVLPAEGVRRLAEASANGLVAEIRAHVLGQDMPVTVPLEVPDLPPPERVADLFIDLGSTTSKWVLAVAGMPPVPGVDSTENLARLWGVEPYRKQELLSETSGDRWSEWLARLVPALRRWVGRSHRAYLRRLGFSLPAIAGFPIARLTTELKRGPDEPLTRPSVPVRFALTRPGATAVKVNVAHRNSGRVVTVDMKVGEDGWTKAMWVQPGETLDYVFVVDDQTIFDPTNSERGPEGRQSRKRAPPAAERAPEGLWAAAARDLVGGRVTLEAEHELIAAQYLRVLEVLLRASRAYMRRFEDRESRVAEQKRLRDLWDAQDRAKAAYEKQGVLRRLFTKRPQGPTGDRPTLGSTLTAPGDWMLDLLNHPGQLEHVVLLDAGGLSLDIAVLEKMVLVPALSRSDASCGGEALSARIGKKATGDAGTRHKAQLGKEWHDRHDLDDRSQREYRDVTRELYWGPLAPLFKDLGRCWKGQRPCSVLLTGGGCQNPHLAELVGELAAATPLAARVRDARDVQRLLQLARDFPEPLGELDSPEIRRFELTQQWSAGRIENPFFRYDTFAVAGGMLARHAEGQA